MSPVNSDFQIISIFVSLLFGSGFCLLYDLIRAWRRTKNCGVIAVFVQDIIYFFFIAFITFLLLLAFSKGEIRAYILLGILVGFLLWNFLISRYFCKAVMKLFSFLYKIFAFFKQLFCKMRVAVEKISGYLQKIYEKRVKVRKNNLKE